MCVSLIDKILIKLRIILCTALFVLTSQQSSGQDTLKQYKGYMLSTVLIDDISDGFDIDKFIGRIQNDSTFYKAFKSLSLVGYTQYNDVQFYDDEHERTDFYTSLSKQKRSANCRTMKTSQVKKSADYYKRNGDYRYKTAELYHKLFLIEAPECGEDNIVNGKLATSESERINQLKKLIFKPGESISGVPGIGGKLGIFEEDRKEQYDFKLTKELYNGEWCYVFKAEPKPGYKNNNVINYLHTWFRAKDYAIVQRNYSLSYKTLLYDFAVTMKVKLKTIPNYLVPYEVYYNGNWHFVGKKRERCEFSALLTDFE